MATKKTTSTTGYRYGATAGKDDHPTEKPNLFYAQVIDHGKDGSNPLEVFRGTSGYTDASQAETEAHAWVRDRGFTAHPA